MELPHKVWLIVDRRYGENLAALEPGVPAWIVDSAANKPVAERLWKDRVADHLTGITVFNDLPASSAEDILITQLADVDLHHGWYSSDPPYTVIEVVGTALSERLKAEFGQYGFDDFRVSPDGFVAVRPLPPTPHL